ncbi:MAG: hypothetical protein HQL87_13310 [Magnetococcales bacterium]|nr:hypothetical protein [Magnetococcales bacterium]
MLAEEDRRPGCGKRRPLRGGVVGVVLVVLGVFATPGSAKSVLAAPCGFSAQQMQWRCPDVEEGTVVGQVYFSVAATRIVKNGKEGTKICKKIRSLYDELQERTTKENLFPYRPFLVEQVKRGRRILSIYVGCYKDKSRSLKILNDVQEQYPKLHVRPQIYQFSTLPTFAHSISLRMDHEVPSGRGISPPIAEERYLPHQIRIDRILCKDESLERSKEIVVDSIKQVKKIIVSPETFYPISSLNLAFSDSVKFTFSELHEIAANITKEYRERMFACSEAVVLKSERGGPTGIRICEFKEGKEDCRCPVL